MNRDISILFMIEQVGDGVQNFAIGDEVYGCAGGLLDLGGGLAQYIAADVNLIAHKPKSLSLIDAAALPFLLRLLLKKISTC